MTTFGVADEVNGNQVILIFMKDGSDEAFKTDDQPFQKINGNWCLCGSTITKEDDGRFTYSPAMFPTSDIVRYETDLTIPSK